jgi:hypothetical protein
MPSHYIAAYTDSGLFYACEHEHPTVIAAAVCMSSAGSYVVAVENGRLRELNNAEEAEFQRALHGDVIERVLRGLSVILPVKWSLS